MGATVADYPRWLQQARRDAHEANRRRGTLRLEVARLAMRVLASLEVDDLPAPVVHLGALSGDLRFEWRRPARHLDLVFRDADTVEYELRARDADGNLYRSAGLGAPEDVDRLRTLVAAWRRGGDR